MKRLLFLSAPLPGHLDWGGYLPTAAALRRRGHEVLWASGAAVKAAVESAGVPFQRLAATGWRWPPPPPLPAPQNVDDPAWRQQRALRALDQWLDEARVSAASTELLTLVREFRPDVVISEMFVAAAGIVAELAGVPLLVAGWPARAPSGTLDDDLVHTARARLERLLRTFGVSGLNWTPSGPPALLSPHLHLTYWSPHWYTGIPLQAQTRHVGGSAPPFRPPDPTLPSPEERPWILITLGTSFNDDPAFFVAAAQAMDQSGCLPIVVLGQAERSGLAPTWISRLPPGAEIRDQVDFAEVLPYVAAAIHHGGAGTTHALITHAVPQLVVPHAADQMNQAQGVLRSGVGVHLPARQVTVERLVTTVAALLPDLSLYRSKAAVLQAEFAALGGIPMAAELIEMTLAKKGAGRENTG